MTETTPLDEAHAAMAAAPEDTAARLRFFERLADAELFLLLTEEAQGETISPELFTLEEGRFVVAFDREERLATFAGRVAPYAAISGRVLAGMLGGQGVGLALNPDVAPSSILIPAEALAWLTDTLGRAPDEVEAGIAELTAPEGLPEALVSALRARLAQAGGLARAAWLVGVTYRDGGRGHMLAILDAIDGAQAPLAKAVSEALTFSGVDAGALDVTFVAASDPVAERLARVGLRFDIPRPKVPEARVIAAPGSDPDKPPILR
ncbi:SseB family protein [Jhaorihella thermophila]|uniref:SseB protein N-terminal domain-containing protein n=1 Tax=Jhaorihella thermophila TaxID=488547 RepID=A0A1H5X040_9RHOB|nr:SseB family protein [Jhaorihella thermophila]SEG04913.1 SseB protein N-terminal domain-containing protein [Jhaorihella thermophila]